MRAALLALLLALPGLARAQNAAAGVVEPTLTIVNGDRYANDAYVNAVECDAGANRNVELRWTATGGTVGSGVFRIWASNIAPPAATNGVVVCPTTNDTQASRVVGRVGDDIPSGITGAAATKAVRTRDVVVGAGYGACAADAEQTVHLCVNFHPYRTAGSLDVDPTPTAYAKGTLTFTTRAPAVPTLDGVRSGNERLYANFTAGAGGAVGADRYRLTATPVAPVQAGAVERSADVGATGESVGGLVNDQPYSVVVRALSVAGNPSGPSNAREGTPIPANDFWDEYRNAGGLEEGGCAAGAAGPLALLGLAAALGLSRARRRS